MINKQQARSLGFDPKDINPGCVVDVCSELLNSCLRNELLCGISKMATAIIEVECIT